MKSFNYHAWLVVNHFVNAEKFDTFYKMLTTTAEKYGIEMRLRTNVELLTEIDASISENRPDFVLFWDKDLNLCRHLENQHLDVFNSSHAIEICDDKTKTLLALEGHGIPMPRTICAPKTFRPDHYSDVSFLATISSRLGFPIVVKEAFGSFGFQVHLARNFTELKNVVQEIGTRPMQFQAFVRSEYCSQTADVRLHVVGGKVVASVLRTAKPGDFRANVTNGGKMEPYTATEAQKNLAIKVCDLLGTDFAGVDLMFGENQEPILCEVNTNAHFKNLFDATGINVGCSIFEHILSSLHSKKQAFHDNASRKQRREIISVMHQE